MRSAGCDQRAAGSWSARRPTAAGSGRRFPTGARCRARRRPGSTAARAARAGGSAAAPTTPRAPRRCRRAAAAPCSGRARQPPAARRAAGRAFGSSAMVSASVLGPGRIGSFARAAGRWLKSRFFLSMTANSGAAFVDALRRAEEQLAFGPQREMEDVERPDLRVARQVDQQVAAGHQVEARERRILQQVVHREQHRLAHLAADPVAEVLLDEVARAAAPATRRPRSSSG